MEPMKLVLVCIAFIVLISCVASIKDGAHESGLRYEPDLGPDIIIHYREPISSQGPEDDRVVNRLKHFMKDYDIRNHSKSNLRECGPDNYPDGSTDIFCVFKDEWINNACNEEMSFGYPRHPCLFLLLNKVEKWVPVTYQSLDELPQSMPVDLRNHIAEVTENNDGKLPEMVWIHCEGQTPVDVENLGTIKYYSPWNDWHGIPAYYFPYKDNPDYMAPMLQIQLDKPQRICFTFTLNSWRMKDHRSSFLLWSLALSRKANGKWSDKTVTGVFPCRYTPKCRSAATTP
ncbi:sodium/potassium-transporting ATPase subunit beta-like isoform X6 [Macrobrachium nipponense]|uniref:sodium/potassium-transporting ATPase subunit beta-like isoform X6 n=2 Tax=Macrobrachium nipponense TaxID=159736 RepID=UPI0030C831C5